MVENVLKGFVLQRFGLVAVTNVVSLLKSKTWLGCEITGIVRSAVAIEFSIFSAPQRSSTVAQSETK